MSGPGDVAPAVPLPRVAVVILQWRRVDETAACLRALAGLDYDNYTVLVVDNHSADGSVERLRQEFPTLAICESPTNLGFAGGCNAGIRVALADPAVRYVLLLNNDTRVEPDLVGEMVAAAEADPAAVVVGAANRTGDRHTSSGGYIRWWTGRYADVFDIRPARELEPLTSDVRMRERVMLGLRLDEPLAVEGIGSVLDQTAVERLERLGLVARNNGSLALTPRGRMLGGGVTADLLA